MLRLSPARILIVLALAVGGWAAFNVASASDASAQTCNNGGVSGSTGQGHTGVPGCNAPGTGGNQPNPPTGSNVKPANARWCRNILGVEYWGYTFTTNGSDCQRRPGYNDPGQCVVAQHILRNGELVAKRDAAWPWGFPNNCLGSWHVDLYDYVACGTTAYMWTALATMSSFPYTTASTPIAIAKPWDDPGCSQVRSSRTEFPGGELWGPLPTSIEANITTPEAAHVGGALRPNQIDASTGRLMCGSAPCPTSGPNAPRINNIAYDLRIDASPTYRECAREGQSGCDYFLRYTRNDGGTGGPVRAQLLAYAATRPHESVNVSVQLRQGTAIQRGTLTQGGYTDCTWRVRTSDGIELPGSRTCQTFHHGDDQPLSRTVPITVFGNTQGSFPVVSATNRVR